MIRTCAAAALLGALLLSAGCRTVAPLRPLSAEDPRPERLLAGWARESEQRSALRGTARLAVDAEGAGRDGRDLRFRSRQALLLARPDRVRVEVRGLLGETLAVFATDGERYDLLQGEPRSFESGPVQDGLLWQVARLDLTPRQAVELILGAPQLGDALAASAAFEVGQGAVRIALADAAGRVRRLVDFDSDGRLRRWQERREDGAVLWETRFDDYASVAGSPVAHTLSLAVRDGRTRALLRLSDVELNPALSPDAFRLEGLAGARAGAEGG